MDFSMVTQIKILWLLVILLFAFPVHAQDNRLASLTSLNIEELINIDVTSVSKKEEKRNDAPAAVSVITRDDIHNLGATSIPEALRLSPGLHVSRITSSQWEVSSRGFSSVNSSKLLVLMDGRSIYTPLVSGVFWDVQDTDFEDLDRIEVIRGPGGTLWGANAMNGIINVITKDSKDTQGIYAETGGGTKERFFSTLRYGGSVGEKGHYRVYAKYFDRAGELNTDYPGTSDKWNMTRAGLRSDWDLSETDKVIVQGDVYKGQIGQVKPAVTITGRANPPNPLRAEVSGGNAMASWTKKLGEGDDLQLRFYYDYTHRDDPTFTDNLHTYDLDFQNRWQLPLSQELLWGADYRLMVDENGGKGVFELDPENSSDRLYSGFIQDTVTFPSQNLSVTLGTKLEHNDYSGKEFQPSARFAWNPITSHTLWGAVSRAVRVPTRLERDVDIAASNPMQNPEVMLLGNRSLRSEKLIAYELGYRFPVVKRLLVDMSFFYNHYTDLMTIELATPFKKSSGQIIVPVENENMMTGKSYGAELGTTYQPFGTGWTLNTNYTLFRMWLYPSGQDLNHYQLFAGSTPAHQVSLGSQVALPQNMTFNAFFRYVGKLTSNADAAVGGAGLSAYSSLDSRLAWQFTKSMEVAVVGQNLLQDHHTEFLGGTQIQRAVYGSISGNF